MSDDKIQVEIREDASGRFFVWVGWECVAIASDLKQARRRAAEVRERLERGLIRESA